MQVEASPRPVPIVSKMSSFRPMLFMVLPLLRLEVVDVVKHMRPRHTSHSKGVSQGPRAIPLDDVSVERLAFSKEMGSTACKAPSKRSTMSRTCV